MQDTASSRRPPPQCNAEQHSGTCPECSCVRAVYAQMSTVFVEQVRAVSPLLVLALCACCVASLQRCGPFL